MYRQQIKVPFEKAEEFDRFMSVLTDTGVLVESAVPTLGERHRRQLRSFSGPGNLDVTIEEQGENDITVTMEGRDDMVDSLNSGLVRHLGL